MPPPFKGTRKYLVQRRPIRLWTPVVVHWEDAYATRDSMKEEDAPELPILIRKTVGFIVLDVADRIVLSPCDDRDNIHNGDAADCWIIPRSLVRRVDKLALGNKFSERKIKVSKTKKKKT
jgi:hypothetical protein